MFIPLASKNSFTVISPLEPLAVLVHPSHTSSVPCPHAFTLVLGCSLFLAHLPLLTLLLPPPNFPRSCIAPPQLPSLSLFSARLQDGPDKMAEDAKKYGEHEFDIQLRFGFETCSLCTTFKQLGGLFGHAFMAGLHQLFVWHAKTPQCRRLISLLLTLFLLLCLSHSRSHSFVTVH